MDKVAQEYLRNGDMTNASQMYCTLERMDPRYQRMARLCRVLCDPNSVPLPHRHSDVCEALLDRNITAEILVGNDLTPEAIQKKYQRLILLVHPDKNPFPQAKEAFLRLANMREEAKDCLYRKLKAKAAQEERMEREAKELKRKGKDVDDGRTLIPNLAELKNQKISLKSLKRKEIDDDFEIFTSGNFGRRERYNPFDIDDDDDVASPNFASTVPGPKRPSKRGASKGPGRWAAFDHGKPIPKKKVDLDKALEEARQYLKEEDELQRQIAKKKEEAAAKLAEQEKPASSRTSSPRGRGTPEGDDDLMKIREQITGLIDHLGECRNRPMKLTSDLSYESYRREKKMGPKPQAFVVVPLQS